MIREKAFILFALLACGLGPAMNCHAADPADCLQYPLYYDETDNVYLFVVDEYINNSCPNNEDGEYYMWISPPPNSTECPDFPEACANCITRAKRFVTAKKTNADNEAEKEEKDKDDNQDQKDKRNEVLVPPTDVAFKTLLGKNDFFTFGRTRKQLEIPGSIKDGVRNQPSKGITLLAVDWVLVIPQTAPNNSAVPIPVKLFTASLDYEAAGILLPANSPQSETRIIRVGFEMAPDAAPPNLPQYIPYNHSAQHPRTYSAMIAVPKDGKDQFKFHVVTHTKLFN